MLHISQVHGRLPFNDSDHRKLLKEVMAGPKFPRTSVSAGCKDIITKIMAPFYTRLNIAGIRDHEWYTSAGVEQRLETAATKPADML